MHGLTTQIQGDLSDLVVGLRECGRADRCRVVCFLPEGDYLVDVSLDGGAAFVEMRAVLRENHREGGTWWTTRSWRVERQPHGAAAEWVSASVRAQVMEIRQLFHRMLRESWRKTC